jgi:phosphoribosyl-ATP pyrophosphohydrolase/phosphoribosyl-AMP cyclohydrolase
MIPAELKWDADGLLPVVIQDAKSGDVLTVAYANAEALQKTIASKSTHLFSRSRQALWHKGESSGNSQDVVDVKYDCDADALLYRVNPHGPGCHTGEHTCFHRSLYHDEATAASGSFAGALQHLETVLERRKSAAPESSYVAKLYAGGVDRIGKKIGEEATEVVIAAKNADRKELVWEAADLLFHLLVLLKHENIPLDEIGAELAGRAR